MLESEFLALEPRERDAEVARARGWVYGLRGDGISGEVWREADGSYARGTMWSSFPSNFTPTTSIASAWELVEEMEPYHFDLGLRNDGWLCRLCSGTDNSRHFEAYGGRRPRYDQAAVALSICLAYLKAKGKIT